MDQSMLFTSITVRHAWLALGLSAAAFSADAVEVGNRGSAPWSANGIFYPVEVTAKAGNRCYMHWLIPWQHGEYDEWGSCSSFVPSRPIKVSWNGAWYEATIVGYGANCITIHYTGYGTDWDECVGQSRIRW
jgi:hypothetical protein